MLRIAPGVLVAALSSLAHGHVEYVQGPAAYDSCCPCPASGGPGDVTKTVTVTATQPASPGGATTVYISQGVQVNPPKETVTVTQAGTTVYVTQTAERVVTKEVVVKPPKTVNIAEEYPEPTDSNGGSRVVTKTVVYGGGDGDIRTITINGDGDKTITVNQQQVITKTVKNNDGEDEYYTVIVKPEPTVKTVTLSNGDVTTKTVEVPGYITVTSPPRIQTVAMTRKIQVDQLKTVTKTVTVAGQTEVQIIIINHVTGVVVCKKKDSGLPCHHNDDGNDDGYQSGSPSVTEAACGTMEVSTSIKTVYNTVVMTVNPDMGRNGTYTASAPTTTETVAKRGGQRARGVFGKGWW